ncbi:MAG: hypothetical protein R3D88_01760 [Alphaproteobacteria bacterium]|nr:hypothetical protein [Alphaproteobacteria bacterium]
MAKFIINGGNATNSPPTNPTQSVFDVLALTKPQQTMYAALKQAFGGDLNEGIVRHARILEDLTTKYKPEKGFAAKADGQPVIFKNNQTKNQLAVTKNSVEFIGRRGLTSPSKKFTYAAALEMAEFVALDINAQKEGITLEGTKREKALMRRAIEQVNKSLPKDQQLTINKDQRAPITGTNMVTRGAKHLLRGTTALATGVALFIPKQIGGLFIDSPNEAAARAASNHARQHDGDKFTRETPLKAAPVAAINEDENDPASGKTVIATPITLPQDVSEALKSTEGRNISIQSGLTQEVFNTVIKDIIADGPNADVTRAALNDRLVRAGYRGQITQGLKDITNVLDTSGLTELNATGNRRVLTAAAKNAFSQAAQQPLTGQAAEANLASRTVTGALHIARRTMDRLSQGFQFARNSGALPT